MKSNSVSPDKVDKSNRPGKGAMLPDRSGHLATGGAHYWFEDLIYNSIPKERILSFDQAHNIRILDNGIIYLNLYEGTFNEHLPENQAKQLAFRDHLGLIRVELIGWGGEKREESTLFDSLRASGPTYLS